MSSRRTDESGRAFAGSQLQIQIYASRKPEILSVAVAEAIASSGKTSPNIQWKAPLEIDNFREPIDQEFLSAIEQGDGWGILQQFWPSRGPNWDALATFGDGRHRKGVFLVEAKSYPNEVYGSGCRATNTNSRNLIERSLNDAKRWFEVPCSTDWLGRLYQYANRLAHVYFLHHYLKVEAWLVNLCFTDDQTTKATTESEWREALPRIKEKLGFVNDIPWVVDVILPARERSEFFQI